MANQSYLITTCQSGITRYKHLLNQLMNAARPLYVLVMTDQPESYEVAKGERIGHGMGNAKDKSLSLSDAVEFDSIVTVRKKQ